MKTFCVFFVCSVVHMSVAAQDSARTLPEIVITATRTPMPREAVTASVTVLDGAALRARGLLTVADALRDLPEAAIVRTGSFGGRTALFLRGGESNFTRVLVDGLPANEPGGTFDFATLSLDNVERIEILRGPASVLYGSDAVSGVVHVVTVKGDGAGAGGAGDLGVRAGTYGTLATSVSGMARRGPLSWAVAVGRQATDGLYEVNNRSELLTGSLRLGLNLRTTTLDFTSRYADGLYRFPTDGSGNIVDANQFQETETVTFGLEVAQRLTPRAEARLHLGLNRIAGGTNDQPDDSGDTVGFFAGVTDRTLLRRSADLRVNLSLGRALVTVGSAVEGTSEQSASIFQSSFGPFESSFDETRRNVAGYVQGTGQLGGAALSAGARLDRNERFGTFVTARGGAAYRLGTGTRVRGTVGTGFKEPTFFENFGGSGVVGNPDLSPEHSTSWELGLEQPLLGNQLRVEATWFNQRFKDLIEFVGAPANAGDPNYVNVAGASADGLELSADIRLPSPVSRLTLRYTRLLTEVTSAGTDPTFAPGDVLVRRPGHAVSARIGVDPIRSVTVAGGVRYTGTRVDLDFSVVDFVTVFAPARVTLDPNVLTDLTVAWRVAPGLTLEGSVENLLDTDYQEVLGFRSPGRTVLVGGRAGM
jgi:vitamin B12 transporter